MASERKPKDDAGEALRLHFGREIQRIRKTSKVSQVKLAEEAGTDPGSLGRLEQGKAPIREDFLFAICRALEYDAGDLVGNVVDAFEQDRTVVRSADPEDPLFPLIRKVREKHDEWPRSDRELLDACRELLRYLASRH
ncbi:MAG TPA: helix-turn-helix transcriptional regulator [Thermoanaerobaculia bacterium]|nr:helix-turn-helix transcriptional regulator [Thermoanaerobaculia bacterium]